MENIFFNCPLCGVKKKEKFHLIEKCGEYKLYQCSDCLGQFWLPFKNPGAEWYEGDKLYSGRNKNPQTGLNWGQKLFFRDCSAAGELLDVGCGTGEFLWEAKKRGFGVYGFDFDRDAVGAAKNYFGLDNVEALPIRDYFSKYPESKFDFITLIDVLEHLDNPRQVLSFVWQALKEQGIMVLTAPNRETISFLKPNDLPPRHLSRWNEASLVRFLTGNGFRVINIRKRTVSLYEIALKFKFKYGKFLSWGIVKKIRERERQSVQRRVMSKNKFLICFEKMAQLRDLLIFLLPSLVIYIFVLLKSKQFLTLYAIAQKRRV